MTEKRIRSLSNDGSADHNELSVEANDELAVMEHASAFDDPIALEHEALAASAFIRWSSILTAACWAETLISSVSCGVVLS